MTQDGHARESGTTSLISGLRVMSYNILADCLAWEHLRTLYNSQPQSVLRWERRCHLIAQEIAHHQPDILCLQEVDHFGFFERELGRLGYQGRYLRRTGNRSDGLAMFWRKSAFASVHMEELRFAELGLKDNVAQVATFELRRSCARAIVGGGGVPASGQAPEIDASAHASLLRPLTPRVVVGNVHVLFNPRRGDVKLAQVRALLRALGAAAARCTPTAPCVACGDFNAVQGSAIYRFIASGRLALAGVDRRRASGQVEGLGWGWERMRAALLGGHPIAGPRPAARGRQTWTPAELAMLQGRPGSVGDGEAEQAADEADRGEQASAQFAEGSSLRLPLTGVAARDPAGDGGFDTSPGSTSAPRDPVLRHPLRLRSGYAAVTGREPLWTTCHDAYMGTVDFVWYGGPRRGRSGRPGFMLEAKGALLPPDPDALSTGLPNERHASDHIPLVVDFELRAVV